MSERSVPDEARAFLTQNYAKLGTRACAKALGWGCTKVSYVTKAMGLTCRPKWDPKDIERLAASVGDLDMRRLKERFGRSAWGIRHGLLKAGVGMGCPQGFEYIDVAARRLGYASSQLRQILKWAEVHVKPAICRPDSPNVRSIVDSADATEAVERWCSMATARDVATQLGISEPNVRKRIRDDPRVTRIGAFWRVPPEVVAELAALDLADTHWHRSRGRARSQEQRV